MKKFFLGGFILIDLALIGGSSFVLYMHVRPLLPMHLSALAPGSKSAASAPAPAAASASPTALAKPAGNVAPASAAAADSSTRKILFTYRNSHSKQVSIRADFTGWKAEPMQKGANGSWTYQAALTPGEYAYCFTADDKTFKDPANKRTKQIGRTLVSAILVEAKK